jgi:hypothetical protein
VEKYQEIRPSTLGSFKILFSEGMRAPLKNENVLYLHLDVP